HTRFSRDWSSDVCSSDLFADNVAILLRLAEIASHKQDHLVWQARNMRYRLMQVGRIIRLAVSAVIEWPLRPAGQVQDARLDHLQDRKSVVQGKRIVIGGG